MGLTRRSFTQQLAFMSSAILLPNHAVTDAPCPPEEPKIQLNYKKEPLMVVTRRNFLRVLGGAVGAMSLPGCFTGPCCPPPDQKKPNILFIFADDHCYEAINALGCDEVITPNLNRLVRRGTTFTHAYNQGGWNGAICIASRTMLNTGKFLWHAHADDKKLQQNENTDPFWADLMRQGGYQTYCSGKWHVKKDADVVFDHCRHIRPGMPADCPEGYNRPFEGQEDVWQPWDESRGGYWQGGKHWSEVLGDDAVGFLEQARQSKDPFFMYLAFNAPHDPRQSPQSYVDKYPLSDIDVPENFQPEYEYKDGMGCGPDLRDERLAPFPRTEYAVKVNRQEYYALITHMDAQIGRILDAVEKAGQAENTYIFFSADHGLAVGHHGLIGKQSMFEHSLRAPLMVCGPGLAADVRIDTPVYIQDIMPTSLALAGLKAPDHVEFKSLVPLLQGRETTHHPAIYGAYIDLQRSVIEDRMKLILYPKIGVALLYDLQNDPHEMHDLADQPEYHATMRQLFQRLLQLQRETGDTLDLSATYPELAA